MGRFPGNNRENSELKKGPWTPEEDQRLVDYIQKHGQRNWQLLPKKAGLNRCGKSCRLRWTNYLRPDIKRGNFSVEEEQTIIDLHSILGNKWSTIAANLPGRTDNEIKNFWNTHLKKRLILSGIDPQTHQPIPGHFLNPPDPMHFNSDFNNLLIMKNPLEVLAKVRLVCNILQILNSNPVPKFLREPSQNVNQYYHGISKLVEVSSTVPNLENRNPSFSNFEPIFNTSATIPQFPDTNYEYSLPAATPEISSGMNENYEQFFMTCDNSVSWGTGMDEEADSFWKDIFIKSLYPHCSI